MQHERRERRQPWPRAPLRSVRAAAALLVLGTVLSWGGADLAAWLTPSLLVAAAAGAALSCGLRAVRTAPGAARSAWLLVAAACLLWSLGDLLWLVDLQVTPLPVLGARASSVGYWSGGALVLAGLVRLSRARLGATVWPRLVLDGALLAGTVFIVAWAYGLGGAARRSGGSWLDVTTVLVNPVFDVLVLGVVTGLLRRTAGPGRRALFLGLASLAMRLVADAVYVVLDLRHDYAPGSWVDALWLGAYVCVAVAPWCGPLTGVGRHVDRRSGRLGTSSALVPYAVTGVVGIAVLLGVARTTTDGADPVVLGAGGFLFLALVVRQALTIADNVALTRELALREDHYRSVVDSSTDVITTVTPAGVVRYLNPAAHRVFGYRTEEVVGRRLLRLVHREDVRALSRVVAGLGDAGMPTRLQCRVRHADGHWIHTESSVSPHRDGFVLTSRDVSDRVELQQELARFAYHDTLTGLPNRALFTERIEAALLRAARGEPAPTVLFLDLDGFKAVNDSGGHAAGDRLLVLAAARLERVADPRDTVARFGGDEFAVLLDRGLDEQTARRAAERMVTALSEPYRLGTRTSVVTASIGIAVARPGSAAEDVLHDADMAMYSAKASGKSRVAVYRAEMHADALQAAELEERLRQALSERRFTLLYQPVVDLSSGEVVAVEALIRWRSREGQLMTPAELISFAENNGQIVELGAWVIEEAVRQAARWRRGGHAVGIAVNLSAPQVVAPGLVEAVDAALRASGLPAEALTLEITESVLVEDVEAAVERLESLRALGVRLAIDDFGTGYSSLAYLRRLPVDVLKIDRSFVSELGVEGEVTALARTIIALGRDLGLTVVAEGVEDAEQAAVLRSLGCHRAQGFYFSGPLDPGGVRAVLRRGPFRVGAPPQPLLRRTADLRTADPRTPDLRVIEVPSAVAPGAPAAPAAAREAPQRVTAPHAGGTAASG